MEKKSGNYDYASIPSQQMRSPHLKSRLCCWSSLK
jgi:hypothetical protein